MKSLSLVLLASASALASSSSPSSSAFRSGDALSHEVRDRVFTARLKEGFHFNEKAPNKIIAGSTTLLPAKLTARELTFAALPSGWVSATARVYVCDDAVTFCEQKSIELKPTAASASAAQAPGAASAAATPAAVATKKASRAKPQLSHGFLVDDLAAALAQARKEKKLVLADFSARWCPGCVRLEDEIFGTREFKSLTSKFVKVKLDVDRFENSVLSEKFKIQGIPTLLVMTPDQAEIGRIYDYQPIATLKGFFESIAQDPLPIADLMAKAKSGDAALKIRAGQRLLAASRPDDALAVLSDAPASPELVQARVESARAKAKENPSAYVRALRDAIHAEPESSRSIAWRTSLIARLEDTPENSSEIEKVRKDGVTLADRLLADPKLLKAAVKTDLVGEYTHYEKLLVASARAELLSEKQEDPAQAKKAWKEAAQVAKSLGITAATPGPALRSLLVLTQAQEFAEADRLALALLKKDPKNVEIQRRRIKILMGLDKPNEAASVAARILSLSYGRNELWVIESLAKAYVAANRPADAEALIERTLTRADLDWSSAQGTKKSLEELKKTVVSRK